MKAQKMTIVFALCSILALAFIGCGDEGGGGHTHTWGEATYSPEPTIDNEGKRIRTCTECGETEEVTIHKLFAVGMDGGTDVSAMIASYLNSTPNNTANNPYEIWVKIGDPQQIESALSLRYVDLVGEFNGIGEISDEVSGTIWSAQHKHYEKLVGLNIKFNPSSLSPNVNTIGKSAFIRCENLKSITLPNTLTSIEINAFTFCENITSITIPASVTTIGTGAFEDCRKLRSVTFQGTITADDLGGGDWAQPFSGDLREKYLAGGIGTYKTTTPVPSGYTWEPVWTKQP